MTICITQCMYSSVVQVYISQHHFLQSDGVAGEWRATRVSVAAVQPALPVPRRSRESRERRPHQGRTRRRLQVLLERLSPSRQRLQRQVYILELIIAHTRQTWYIISTRKPTRTIKVRLMSYRKFYGKVLGCVMTLLQVQNAYPCPNAHQ